MQKDDSWKTIMAVVYAVICEFDFIIVPSWIGMTRADVFAGFEMMQLTTLDPQVQIKLIDSLTYQHMPFTLQGGGLFHLAFGALLTGSALNRLRGDK